MLLSRLEAEYGVAQWAPGRDAIETLVRCVLSQNTSDGNAASAYAQLQKAYANWGEVADSSEAGLAEVIRSGGLGATKARTIIQSLRSIRDREGAITLERIAWMGLSEATEYLVSIPGIGCKTAAIVLNFAFGLPVLAVDTHVNRVLVRTGLVPPSTGPCRSSALVSPTLPATHVYRFHIALIRHGRARCHARRPQCAGCPIGSACPAARAADCNADWPHN